MKRKPMKLNLRKFAPQSGFWVTGAVIAEPIPPEIEEADDLVEAEIPEDLIVGQIPSNNNMSGTYSYSLSGMPTPILRGVRMVTGSYYNPVFANDNHLGVFPSRKQKPKAKISFNTNGVAHHHPLTSIFAKDV